MKIFGVIITAILTSFYFYPFEFFFLPGVNTKMMMAVAGLVVLGFSLAKSRSASVDKDFITVLALSLAVSLISLVSVTVNGTNERTFLTYFVSMFVWLSAAYVLCKVIKLVHGDVSVELVCQYLILVSSLQCILALAMSMYTPLRLAVDGLMATEAEAYMGVAEGRLYGIGCALDVAGLKFSAVLVLLAHLCVYGSEKVRRNIIWYILAFCVITVIGNMISRTTTVGVTLALAYWCICAVKYRFSPSRENFRFALYLAVCVIIAVPLLTVWYNASYVMQENIRFAFEGFFSLFETGKWQTGSNDILFNHMIVFPETLKTWIIGDGYAANPYFDPYYVGRSYHGFYKETDIGYLRYIFYFGLIGLAIFIAYFCVVARVCAKCFPAYAMMFMFVLAVNFIGWVKVSTDIFVVFAPFLCLAFGEASEKGTTEEESADACAEKIESSTIN